MSTYYCLVAGLPDISLDDGKLSYSVSDFKAELYPDLSAQDRKLIDLFYLKFDNMAILKLLKNKDTVIEDKGNFSGLESSFGKVHYLFPYPMKSNVQSFPAALKIQKYAR
jgi:hypothetical protein